MKSHLRKLLITLVSTSSLAAHANDGFDVSAHINKHPQAVEAVHHFTESLWDHDMTTPISIEALEALPQDEFILDGYLFSKPFFRQILFPHTAPNNIHALLLNEITPTSIQTPDDQQAGFNQPLPTASLWFALTQARDQVVADCGAGYGFFSAKLLAAGAQQVIAIDPMASSYQEIPKTIKHYEDQLQLDFSDRYQVINNDATRGLKALQEQGVRPDMITAFKVLHFLTPKDAQQFLKQAHATTNDKATLWISAQAPSASSKAVSAYLKAKSYKGRKNRPFAGYMIENVIHTVIYDKVTQKKSFKGGLTGKTVVSAHVLSPKRQISPLEIWYNHYHRNNKYDAQNKPTVQFELVKDTPDYQEYTYKQSQASLMWDLATAKHLARKTGWTIQNVYYMDTLAKHYDEFPAKVAKTTTVNIFLRMTKNPTPPVHDSL